MTRTATFSPCRTWRYSLERIWDDELPRLNVIGLNPSTADETVDDPTIRRCVRYARDWGLGGLVMTNLFAYRSTDPKVLLKVADPVGPDNHATLWQVAAETDLDGGLVLAAWVAGASLSHAGAETPAVLMWSIGDMPVYVLGLTKGGHPRHPLYMRADVKPVRYAQAREAA